MMSVATHQNLDPGPNQQRALIRVVDFSCAGESAALERRLRRVSGVRSVTVNPVTETAYVTFDPRGTNSDELEFVVAAAGYRVA
jgi:P-type Cu2+ transporter